MTASEKHLEIHRREPAGSEEIPVHPLGKRAKVLLTSVFGPVRRRTTSTAAAG